MNKFLFCIVPLFAACGISVEQINFVEGEWENITDSTQFSENWKKINDTFFSGEAFAIANGDTIFNEKISIEKQGNDFFYYANVSDQNEGKPIPFKLISSGKTFLVFENPEHDFPKKITYTKISDDSLLVKIDGEQNGQNHSEVFPFKRK